MRTHRRIVLALVFLAIATLQLVLVARSQNDVPNIEGTTWHRVGDAEVKWVFREKGVFKLTVGNGAFDANFGKGRYTQSAAAVDVSTGGTDETDFKGTCKIAETGTKMKCHLTGGNFVNDVELEKG